MTRRLLLATLLVLAPLTVLAAVAYACSPQANLTGDRSAGGGAGFLGNHPAGSDVGVTGVEFLRDAPVSVTWNGIGTELARPRTDGRGAFRALLQIPEGAAPGTYTVVATVTSSNGDTYPAPASLRVTARQGSPSSPESGPTSPNSPDARSTPVPGGSVGAPSRSRSPDAPAPSAALPRNGNGAPATRSPATEGRSGTGRSAAALRTSSGAETPSGLPAFPGSVAADAEASGGRSSSVAGSALPAGADAGRASETSASDDLWGGFDSESRPSPYAAGAGSDAVSEPSITQLTLGLALLAVGSIALLAGALVAATRRRRALSS